jgi:pantothenate kinase
VLSEQKSFDVLHRVILPVATRSAVSQPRPVVVVAGQPGAGKTAIADLVQAALGRRGGAVRVGRITECLVSVRITRWNGL